MNDLNLNKKPVAPPEVSVIINCHNEAQFVGETLDSVFAQTFEDWEIVFWDNASTDGSGDIAASYGDKVRYFRSEEMVSLGRARRLAYDQSRGKFIAILDADDLWLPQKLERQVALFQADPQVGMTYCDTMGFDDDGDRFRLYKSTTPYRGQAFGQLIAKNFICSSAMMFRREAVEQLGCAFDDRFARAQDYDLSLRLAYQFPMDFVDEPLTKWRINGVFEKPWKRGLVSRAEDVKLTMENLLELHPEIEAAYPDELRGFYKELDYGLGVSSWQKGNRTEARRYLARHLTARKFAVVYFSTFLMSSDFFYKTLTSVRDLITRRK